MLLRLLCLIRRPQFPSRNKLTDLWLPLFWAILMKIGNVWALTTAEVCLAPNKVRAMKLCMVLVWIVILILSEWFGSNTVCLFYNALTGNIGTIYAYIKTKFIKNTKSNIKSFWQKKHNVHLYLLQQSHSLSIQYLLHKLRITYFVWRPSLIVSMATGGEIKIIIIITFLSQKN